MRQQPIAYRSAFTAYTHQFPCHINALLGTLLAVPYGLMPRADDYYHNDDYSTKPSLYGGRRINIPTEVHRNTAVPFVSGAIMEAIMAAAAIPTIGTAEFDEWSAGVMLNYWDDQNIFTDPAETFEEHIAAAEAAAEAARQGICCS